MDILQAADRFMIDDLKQSAESYIEQSVDLENVAWLLEISDRFNSPKLRRVCIELICQSVENWNAVRNSNGYQDICISSPHLMRELDYRLSKNNIIQPGDLFRSRHVTNS